jgi:hypothetical protein
MNVIPINIPDVAYPHRHYCVQFNNAYVLHKEHTITKGIGSNWVEITCDGRKIEVEKKDYEKAGRHDLLVSNEIDTNEYYDEIVSDDAFLLYDPAGLNYAHFFFDLFGKCLYYEELLKTNPNLKLGLIEDFNQTEGNSNFVRQWLNLYFKDKNIDIVVFEKNKRYKVLNLFIANTLYGFPEPQGDDYIISKIIETANKIPSIEVKTNGCYISRQDTIKRGWYHKRDLVNELELIDKIKSELGYDIIELMDYDLIGKIQIFKSYKNIIQQSSASNINILFSTSTNNNIIITHPKLEGWLASKVSQFSFKSKAPLLLLNDGGECVEELDENWIDKNNAPWELTNIGGLVEVLKQIDQSQI